MANFVANLNTNVQQTGDAYTTEMNKMTGLSADSTNAMKVILEGGRALAGIQGREGFFTRANSAFSNRIKQASQ